MTIGEHLLRIEAMHVGWRAELLTMIVEQLAPDDDAERMLQAGLDAAEDKMLSILHDVVAVVDASRSRVKPTN